jgi:hypothetical protein
MAQVQLNQIRESAQAFGQPGQSVMTQIEAGKIFQERDLQWDLRQEILLQIQFSKTGEPGNLGWDLNKIPPREVEIENLGAPGTHHHIKQTFSFQTAAFQDLLDRPPRASDSRLKPLILLVNACKRQGTEAGLDFPASSQTH